jgi:hypothetical protein
MYVRIFVHLRIAYMCFLCFSDIQLDVIWYSLDNKGSVILYFATFKPSVLEPLGAKQKWYYTLVSYMTK